MGELDARRRAAWKFVRAVIRSQRSGVAGAALSGLLWQAAAVSALLMVKQAIDHGILTKDRHSLLLWVGALLAVGLLEMAAGAVRHLYAIRNRARSDARVLLTEDKDFGLLAYAGGPKDGRSHPDSLSR